MTSAPSAPSSTEDLSASAAISHQDAINYWSGVSATVTGMLGGYPEISRIDLRGSRAFLTKLRRKSTLHPTTEPLSRVADCGAGIGRITLGFLIEVAKTVDIVEPVKAFTDEFEGKEEVRKLREEGRVGEVYVVGLEEWTPLHRYAVVWNQWCLSQLRDTELVEYLKRCVKVLEPGGWIVVKENTMRSDKDEDEFDEVDSSVTRTDRHYRDIFMEAGLKLVATEVQNGLPKDLFPVRMYALQPNTTG